MTYKSKPPMMTHQPGLPADSASRTKPGSSPKPPSSSPLESLRQCEKHEHLDKGTLVFVWSLTREEFVPFIVVGDDENWGKKSLGRFYLVLDTSNGKVHTRPSRSLHVHA